MMTHTQEEIKEALKQHRLYLAYQAWAKADRATRGEEPPKGIRFALKRLMRADLSETNLRCADLSGADLRKADLWKADLSGADLSGAVLWKADLSGAVLWKANLRGTDLRAVIGNGIEIKSIYTGKDKIAWTNTDLAIGGQQHPLATWLKFSDEEKAEFGVHALEYLNKWLPKLDSMGVFDAVKGKETE